ncbi:hypothetical protein [Fortiea contorta]|uniref:hypothetical protein n=1 Tax=Fortiea contorta TaxID=1892405 RepID=UPI0003459F07|nr:hypothetical protein [Fortiea contorta]
MPRQFSQPINRYLVTAVAGIILWNALSSAVWAQSTKCEPKSQLPATVAHNSFSPENAIVIGKLPEQPYIVIVPGESDQLLNSVKACVSHAFLAHHQLGNYVFTESFSQKADAYRLSDLLRSHGLDARVVYFR